MERNRMKIPYQIVNEDLQALPEGLVATHRAFDEALNSGNVDAIMAFYEPDARLVVMPGQEVVGHEAIRRAVEDFQEARLELRPRRVVFIPADGVALVMGAWAARTRGEPNSPALMEGTAVDILRRQANGRWLYAVDDPWGITVLDASPA